MIHPDPNADTAFDEMPSDFKALAEELRALIAVEADGLEVQECLRWGQPTYIASKGSMLRIVGWSFRLPTNLVRSPLQFTLQMLLG